MFYNINFYIILLTLYSRSKLIYKSHKDKERQNTELLFELTYCNWKQSDRRYQRQIWHYNITSSCLMSSVPHPMSVWLDRIRNEAGTTLHIMYFVDNIENLLKIEKNLESKSLIRYLKNFKKYIFLIFSLTRIKSQYFPFLWM